MTDFKYIPPIKRGLKIVYIPNGEYIYPYPSDIHFSLSHWNIDAYREKIIKKFVNKCSRISNWGVVPKWFNGFPRNHVFDINEFEFILIEEGSKND